MDFSPGLCLHSASTTCLSSVLCQNHCLCVLGLTCFCLYLLHSADFEISVSFAILYFWWLKKRFHFLHFDFYKKQKWQLVGFLHIRTENQSPKWYLETFWRLLGSALKSVVMHIKYCTHGNFYSVLKNS